MEVLTACLISGSLVLVPSMSQIMEPNYKDNIGYLYQRKGDVCKLLEDIYIRAMEKKAK